jgi:hypothetical protein
MTTSISLGFDMGMGALKLWSVAGGWQLVSQVASNGQGHLSDGIIGLKNRKRPMLVNAGGSGTFFVGDGAHEHGRPVENLDFERLTGAPEMRVLLYAALAQYQNEYGPFDASLSLMVGLPLQMMTGEQAKNYQRDIRNWLKGTHQFDVDGISYSIEVEDVKQTPQPVGALFDYVLDHRAQMIADRGSLLLEEVGVISVGFNTVELLVVRDRGAVERFTTGATVGVRRLLELINREGLFSLGELDSKLRAGRLNAELKQALPVWSREVNGEIEKRWGQSHRRFAKVLIVGGGALLLKEALTLQFGHKAYVPSDPVLSIARGLWKLSSMKK